MAASSIVTSADAAAFAQGGSGGAAWDYAPAPETAKVVISPRYNLFINGRFVAPAHARSRGKPAVSRGRKVAPIVSNSHAPLPAYFPTINPATESPLSEVAQASDADVDAAVRAAAAALPRWAALKPTERAKYLFRIARRIQERARELAILETLDGGKPIRESRDVDIPLAAQHFFYHAGWCDKLQYAFPSSRGTPPRPVGVCGQIIPWNFPLLMAAWKLAPALACGNTCVLKPAETTPLTALRLAEILAEIDLPPGVVNIVTGDGRAGAALVNHPGVAKIAFTGSTDVGKRIAASIAEQSRAAGTAKKLTLELGGKSPNIIFDDASIDQAVEGIIAGIFFNQGHVCCAGSRLFVQEGILPEVAAKLAIRMSSIRVGDPLDKNTDLGAINSRMQRDKIEQYLHAGQREGARLRVSGALGAGVRSSTRAMSEGESSGSVAAALAVAPKGYWCRPCFFEGVQPSHTIAREEIFGPVLAVMSFRTPEEAITRANNSPYGLAAGVWTDKGSKIFQIARQLEAGVVWLNTYNRFDAASPFGGYKESGFGREGGLQGLRGYLDLD
ncbi:MAG: aldehyde dehydrogenase family protein [Phycisphaerales bacterium]